jgi:nucleotide-binding universal stress UspA family protein
MSGTMVVGVDGSAESRTALVWAADLAVATDALVVAVHAIGLLERLPSSGHREPAAGHLEEIRRILEDDWCEILRRRGAQYRTEVDYGHPADVLLASAARLGAVLIVVGSRGIGAAPSGGLGSSSMRVARQSEVPVVIVPGRQS